MSLELIHWSSAATWHWRGIRGAFMKLHWITPKFCCSGALFVTTGGINVALDLCIVPLLGVRWPTNIASPLHKQRLFLPLRFICCLIYLAHADISKTQPCQPLSRSQVQHQFCSQNSPPEWPTPLPVAHWAFLRNLPSTKPDLSLAWEIEHHPWCISNSPNSWAHSIVCVCVCARGWF